MLQNDLDLFKTRLPVDTVANILGVTSEAVKKWVRELFPNEMVNGKLTMLTEAQVTGIKLKMRPTTKVVANKTSLEKKLLIQQAMNFLNEEIEELKHINKQQETLLIEQAPKVQLAETCLRSEKEMSIRDAGKHLGLSQTEIFKIMRDNEYLTKANMPTQKALNRKILSVKTGESYGDIWKQAVMTLDNIMEFQKRHLGEVK